MVTTHHITTFRSTVQVYQSSLMHLGFRVPPTELPIRLGWSIEVYAFNYMRCGFGLGVHPHVWKICCAVLGGGRVQDFIRIAKLDLHFDVNML